MFLLKLVWGLILSLLESILWWFGINKYVVFCIDILCKEKWSLFFFLSVVVLKVIVLF